MKTEATATALTFVWTAASDGASHEVSLKGEGTGTAYDKSESLTEGVTTVTFDNLDTGRAYTFSLLSKREAVSSEAVTMKVGTSESVFLIGRHNLMPKARRLPNNNCLLVKRPFPCFPFT